MSPMSLYFFCFQPVARYIIIIIVIIIIIIIIIIIVTMRDT